MNELKRCPFCKGRGHVESIYDRRCNEWFRVKCEDCWGASGYHKSKSLAIETWNKWGSEEELHKIQKRLEKLTPGGSEFYNDPDKCLDWLQMQNDSYKEQFKRRRKAEQELEQVKKERDAAVECIANSCKHIIFVKGGKYCTLKDTECDGCESIWRRKEE